MFDRLVHADWSKSLNKRWMSVAERRSNWWDVECLAPVGNSRVFLDREFSIAQNQRVLVGFDFPIGLPVAYGVKTGFGDYLEALAAFGHAPWEHFFDVAVYPEQVCLRRPFYPHAAVHGVKRESLVCGLNVLAFNDLLRECDRRTDSRREACSLFWTLGGNQVGRAAIAGWQEIIGPAMQRGAKLWPFHGGLSELATTTGLVIAETYPAIAYSMVGAKFLGKESKRRQIDRKRKAGPVLDWTERNRVHLSNEVRDAVVDGFGKSTTGEDRFDAFFGLLKMIEVADGRRPAGIGRHLKWEGWILGDEQRLAHGA